MLIGSRDSDSSSEKVEDLNDRIDKFQAASAWRVRDLTEVLHLTERSHADLIEIYRIVEAESEEFGGPRGATLRPNRGGTAFPICRTIRVRAPTNDQLSGIVCSLAPSRTVTTRSCSG